MPAKKTKTDIDKELIKELKDLTKEVGKVKDLEFMKVFKNPVKFLWFSFLKGLMVGFGSVLGATVVVTFFIFLMTKISFVPILGDFVQKVIDEVVVTEQAPQAQPLNESINQVDNVENTNNLTTNSFKSEFSAIVPNN